MNLGNLSFSLFYNRNSEKVRAAKYTPRAPIPEMNKLIEYNDPAYVVPIMPPKVHKQALVLDLDETLVHTSSNPPKTRVDYFQSGNLYVYIRPNIRHFMDKVSKMFDVFIFTASEQSYADPIIDQVCPGVDMDHRIYRESCKFIDGNVCKDLGFFNRSLRKIILVDDKVNTFTFFPDNTISIRPWTDQENDTVLVKRILPVLKKCHKATDVRSVIEEYNRDNPP